jgi:peroxidase
MLLSPVCFAFVASGETRSFDGSGNNELHLGWGAAGARLERLSTAYYGDQVFTMAEDSRPNPRNVSNVLSEQVTIMGSGHHLSDMVWVWGQFLDHDISITPESKTEFAPVMTAADDMLAPMIPMMRSDYDLATGTDATNPRQQTNAITAFIDGSGIYGSSEARAMRLRTGQGGRLVMTADGMLPRNLPGIDMANPVNLPAAELHSAGDVRANENPALLAMHTLWAREHNRLASQVASEQPDWTDEEIFQYARRVVGAEIQSITYQEFLPALLGSRAPSLDDAAYDPSLNPGILNEFSAGLYRLGHSMIPTHIAKIEPDGSMSDVPLIILRDCFFNPQCLDSPAAVDAVFRGLMVKQMQEVDVLVVDDLRNFLFGEPGAGGLDLISLNIQRGRDHGLPGYNAVRASLGLEPRAHFAEITTSPGLVAGLESLYDSTDSLDLWIGAMSEPHDGDGSVGETIEAGILAQFIRLRDGDRFFFHYDDAFSADEKTALMNTRLSDVISRNTSVGTLPLDAFHAHDSMMVDSDGDGMNDLAESIAGTDPNDASSLFQVLNVERTPSGTLLEWSSVPGKLYTIEYLERIGSSWIALKSIEAPGAGSVQVFTDIDPTRSSNREGYYRVNIRR